ncbi:hypothetical protein A3A67_03095 [Candidatus Peribacteria bacterium RIFCSPLOWO2_01_FULL_51_18]|nr:MAG: hypothetical protein A3C52_05170 [Candidatus Peribacteria bacterium RIFCSPHIGHO2_02_FULL_51_15]OGJ66030.1 MAG: hypothetical protein A3A67_03095 [Candidatus Peribacteria bacterium RIFCSPLOWO2_01_FULL_51_18]OGJ69235.1 MAG: hypothetical protein A3J34_00360 [Candidatus Peribacteria bacterium RIFCSPLOWO2_02_FULL_51_10]
MMNPRKVTIIIPAFNGWSGLERCIRSCASHIASLHDVIVVDDGSDEPGFGEDIQRAISGLPNFRYFRLPKNSGFIKACNHAVFNLAEKESDILLLNSDAEVTEGFLEEMLMCLYSSEHHGVCCPRSNSATICTFPFLYTGDRKSFRNLSYDGWLRFRNSLPRFSVIPTGVGFCMLIRRSLINRFGLFDEIYGQGYNEENDFCFRINRFGYSTVMANRSYVFHVGGGSFAETERNYLERYNRRILFRRYPEYPRVIGEYIGHYIPAHEYFADLLSGIYPRKKILIDLSHLVAAYNGTSEYALSLLHELKPILDSKYDVTVHCTKRADDFFGLSGKYPRIWHAEDGINERYDLAFVPHQIFSTHHLFRLNRLALRFVVNALDIIALRCQYLKRADIESALRLSVCMADAVTTISQASLDDLRCYLGDGGFRPNQSQRVIHLAYPDPEQDESVGDETGLPEKGFIFLVGNKFDHKAVDLALGNLSDTRPIVVLGGKKRVRRRNTICLESGNLSERLINSLYQRCSVIVFPSQYEGFGLPFLKAAGRGKPIIACDTGTTREIALFFGIENLVYKFKNFSEIPSLVDLALSKKHEKPARRRTWREAAEETADFISAVLAAPVDLELLDRRNELLDSMERMKLEQDCGIYMRNLALRPWRLFVGKLKRAAEPILGLFGR